MSDPVDILGVDPEPTEPEQVTINDILDTEESEQPAAETAETVETTETPATTEDGPTPEELTQLREKGRIFDVIENDPELVGMITDYMRRKNGQAPTPTPQPTRSEPTDNPEVATLKQQLGQLQQAQRVILANMQLQQFAAKTPDFDQFKQPVSELLRKHPTLTLEEAYNFAKRTHAPTAAPTRAVAPPEGKAVMPSKPTDGRDIRKRVADSKLSFDQAFDLALQEVMRGSE